jgi:hypothetical protein
MPALVLTMLVINSHFYWVIISSYSMHAVTDVHCWYYIGGAAGQVLAYIIIQRVLWVVNAISVYTATW